MGMILKLNIKWAWPKNFRMRFAHDCVDCLSILAMPLVCLFVCVCCHARATYMPCLYVEHAVPSGSLWHFQGLYHVVFSENTLFKSYGVIC